MPLTSCLIWTVLQIPLTIYGGVRIGRTRKWHPASTGIVVTAGIVGTFISAFQTSPAAGLSLALLGDAGALYGLVALVKLCSPVVRAQRERQADEARNRHNDRYVRSLYERQKWNEQARERAEARRQARAARLEGGAERPDVNAYYRAKAQEARARSVPTWGDIMFGDGREQPTPTAVREAPAVEVVPLTEISRLMVFLTPDDQELQMIQDPRSGVYVLDDQRLGGEYEDLARMGYTFTVEADGDRYMLVKHPPSDSDELPNDLRLQVGLDFVAAACL